MPVMNMVNALNLALRQEMKKDNSVVVLGEDVGINGGVFRVTDGLLKLYGKKRVIDTPLAESGIIGASIGMAINGLRPVAEIQFSGFMYSAFDQIISHASRIRNRSRGRYSCPVVIRTPYSGGIKALEHHSESMEALYTHIPGIKVVIPSTPADAKGLLISAIRDPDPVIFLEPKRIYRAVKEYVQENEYIIPIGKARLVREGNQVSIICWGAMVRECERAVLQSGIDAEIIDLRSLKPFDVDLIIESVKKTRRVVVVHEAPKTNGFGAEIIATINENALLYLDAPPIRVTGFDSVIPLGKLEDVYLPNVERINKALQKVVSF